MKTNPLTLPPVDQGGEHPLEPSESPVDPDPSAGELLDAPHKEAENSIHLRQRAEKLLRERAIDLSKLSRKALEELTYTLQVRQVELELRNEALGQSQIALQVAHDDLKRQLEKRIATLAQEIEEQKTAVSIDTIERKQAEEALRVSEERFRTLFEAAEDSIFIKDHHLRYIAANPAMGRLFGLPAAKLIGATDEDLFGEQAGAHIREVDSRVLTGETIREEHTKSVQGEPRTFHVIKVPMRNGAGQITGLCGIARDITKRKQAVEALRESEERYRRLVKTSPDSIVLTDLTGNILICNRQTALLHGIEQAEEMIGRNAFEFIAAKDKARARTNLEKALAGQKVNAVEYEMVRQDGSFFYAELHASLIRDTAGQPQAFIGVTRDITGRKRAEEALHRSAERLQILHDIDRAILAAQTPEAIALVTLSNLRRLIPYTQASVAEINLAAGTGRELFIVDHTGEKVSTSQLFPLAGNESIIAALAQGRPHVVQNITTRAEPAPVERFLLKAGIHGAYLSAPLIIQGELVGSLNLATGTPHTFIPEYIEITQEVANSLAVSLNQARLHAQTQQDARIKTDLLCEVNHRVSNNLSAIIGLLNVETHYARTREDWTAEAVLSRLTGRVQGLATVHRLLSQSQWSPVMLSNLAAQVIQAALSALPSGRRIQVEITPSPVVVSAPQAGNLALILNELTTNTIKHSREKPGWIAVEIEQAGDWIDLTYQDGGPGYPAAVLSGEAYNVGLYLLEQLTGTLSGQLHLDNDGGAVARLRFPVEQDGVSQ